MSEASRLRALAKRGDAESAAQLVLPSYPRAIAYLHDWIRELHGRSGVGMHGINPLTYATIKYWSDLSEQRPAPHEVSALFELDAAMLHPPELPA